MYFDRLRKKDATSGIASALLKLELVYYDAFKYIYTSSIHVIFLFEKVKQ